MKESPAPAHEWRSLEALFGADRLSELLGISPVSVPRYRSGSRPTPDALADRLHFLATVVGDLAGAYNEVGIRRWFDRKRTVLDGRSPAEMLRDDWSPEAPEARRVRDISHALLSSPAT